MGFPQYVAGEQAYGVAGDLADANPRSSVVPPTQNGFVEGANGVYVGRFAWSDGTSNVNNTGAGIPPGFVGRSWNALITQFLAYAI